MTTNTHILTLNDRLAALRHIITRMDDNEDKQVAITLLNDICDHLFCANVDLEIAKKRIAELSKQIFEPIIGAQLTYPEQDDYNAVREYVENRKQRDPIFKKYCATHTRKELCLRLSDEFGWVVDSNSYGKNLQRH